MDSKLKRFCIVCSFSVIVLVVLLVVYINQEEKQAVHSMGGTVIQTPVQTAAPMVQQEVQGTRTEKGVQIGYSLKAFLTDNSFFDEEPPAETVPLDRQLSMIVTSVEKDMRIQIVDGEGSTVTGESFLVNIEGLGEYKDLDKDGIIYVGDVDSGEYALTLKPLNNYAVSQTPTKVDVKDKVEYVAIKDISLLMKTEADIVAEEEDTAIRDALEDADKSEIKKLQKTTANSSVGIDVSKWNKEIDWDKVKAAGVDFAIIRAGYRGSQTGALVMDPYFEQNMRGAANANVITGVYFFTQATNEVEAVEEASMVVRLLQDYDIQYPVFIDTEGAGGNGRADDLDVETRTRVCEAFCETIENEGYHAGVYASRNWYNNRLEAERLEKYFIWLAEYRKEPLYQGEYQMWQYTSKGSIDGIEGNVDMNVSYLGVSTGEEKEER